MLYFTIKPYLERRPFLQIIDVVQTKKKAANGIESWHETAISLKLLIGTPYVLF